MGQTKPNPTNSQPIQTYPQGIPLNFITIPRSLVKMEQILKFDYFPKPNFIWIRKNDNSYVVCQIQNGELTQNRSTKKLLQKLTNCEYYQDVISEEIEQIFLFNYDELQLYVFKLIQNEFKMIQKQTIMEKYTKTKCCGQNFLKFYENTFYYQRICNQKQFTCIILRRIVNIDIQKNIILIIQERMGQRYYRFYQKQKQQIKMIRKFQLKQLDTEYYVEFYRGDLIYWDADNKYSIMDLSNMKIKGRFYGDSINELLDSIIIKQGLLVLLFETNLYIYDQDYKQIQRVDLYNQIWYEKLFVKYNDSQGLLIFQQNLYD